MKDVSVVDKTLALKQLVAVKASLKHRPLMEVRRYPKNWMRLVAILLSSRTKDEITEKAADNLFLRFYTLRQIAVSKPVEIAKIIFPVGFYKVKAKNIVTLAKELLADYNGKVPSRFNDLVKLPGVGRKTANLYLSLCGQQSIAVDTHVHRIANRIPWVNTVKPEQTESALKRVFPRNRWSEVSSILVPFGQQVCRPAGPRHEFCPRVISNMCLYRKCDGIVKEVRRVVRSKVGSKIRNRLKDFQNTFKTSERKWFKELVLCILTAHASAKMSLKAVDFLGSKIFSQDVDVLAKLLREAGYRFPFTRARYIVENRKFLGSLKKVITNFSSSEDARKWLAENAKGIGYKEASHFLRNVGYKDVAIIDFHVLDILKKAEIIREENLKLTPTTYLQIETILNKIAIWCKMSLAELDLCLWYIETGKVLK